MSNCLFCYQPLAANEQDFHISCSKKIFGQPTPPALPYAGWAERGRLAGVRGRYGESELFNRLTVA